MKIVLFKNTIESQEFFSFELAKCFKALGHDIYIYDCADPITSKKSLDKFVDIGNTVFLAFNFNGMINDPLLCEKNGKDPVYLKKTGIPIINIVVDHPYYYHKEFVNIPEKYIQISIDENHRDYMRRFFPEINAENIVYLGGTQLIPYVSGTFEPGSEKVAAGKDDLIPFFERKNDIIFCGNYMKPEYFEKYLKGCDKAVIDFYHAILDALKKEPHRTLEDVAIERIVGEFGDKADDNYLRDCLENMIFLDLQIRHYFRGLAVSAIADAGYKITVYGAGYEDLPLRHPENIVNMGNVDSVTCLKAIANARVSLNIMPWFKKGGHDRVYNTCLNGALCLSDTSEALLRQFSDGNDIIFYELETINDLKDGIAEKYAYLFDNKNEMKDIAEAGYENALKNHRWSSRALELESIMSKALV